MTIAANAGAALELARAQAYADASRSPNTHKAYSNDWRGFCAWCAERGGAARDADPTVVASYLAWMADSKYESKTIERAYNGISWHLRAIDSHVWRKGSPPAPVVAVLGGIRRMLQRAPNAKNALSLAELRAILPLLGNGLQGSRNRALMLVAFYCAMRRSELIALNAADIVLDRNGLQTFTRKSKTDQEGRGLRRHAMHEEDSSVCAPCTLHRWMTDAKIESGPLFRRIGANGVVLETRLHAGSVTRILQTAAEKIGIDPSAIGAHSLRAGYVTSAAKSGKEIATIMKQTGHKNADQVRAYIRHPSVWDDNATDGLDE